MKPVAMECQSCGVEIRGKFNQSRFDALSSEDAVFLEKYLLAGFSIKALAEETGLGYVAIRNRLDRIIDGYRNLYDMEKQKRSILNRLENGELSADEAAEALERL